MDEVSKLQVLHFDNYKEVDKEDFYELTDCFRTERKRAASEADKIMFQEKHHSMGPPPKETASDPAPGRATPAPVPGSKHLTLAGLDIIEDLTAGNQEGAIIGRDISIYLLNEFGVKEVGGI